MRRRQLFHLIYEENERHRLEREVYEPKKGFCPKCGQKIGRGIAGHMRKCNGNNPGNESNNRGAAGSV